jgi:hypothetical protein
MYFITVPAVIMPPPPPSATGRMRVTPPQDPSLR